ncbi:hypothetical protein J6590_075075 [Homalodisca vitripennis]|nr:hypothetical protein J6590_075075 [Homalodisca vitripennis]
MELRLFHFNRHLSERSVLIPERSIKVANGQLKMSVVLLRHCRLNVKALRTDLPMAQCSGYNGYRKITRSSNTDDHVCPCKQPAYPAIGGGSEVIFKPLFEAWLCLMALARSAEEQQKRAVRPWINHGTRLSTDLLARFMVPEVKSRGRFFRFLSAELRSSGL